MNSRYTIKDKLVITILLIIIISCIILLVDNINLDFTTELNKAYDLSADKGGLPYPVQTNCVNISTTLNVDGTPVTMTKVAKYKIIGRVESISYHYGIVDITKKLSTRDFQLSFGEIALDKNSNRISYNSSGRYGAWYCNSQEFLNEYGTFDVISKNTSNNHIVPANDEIKKIAESVEVGNVVEIEGYLSTYKWSTEKGEHFWGTSTSRNDSGDGACETIYVESLKIIQ